MSFTSFREKRADVLCKGLLFFFVLFFLGVVYIRNELWLLTVYFIGLPVFFYYDDWSELKGKSLDESKLKHINIKQVQHMLVIILLFIVGKILLIFSPAPSDLTILLDPATWLVLPTLLIPPVLGSGIARLRYRRQPNVKRLIEVKKNT